jgi:hypothetical protein
MSFWQFGGGPVDIEVMRQVVAYDDALRAVPPAKPPPDPPPAFDDAALLVEMHVMRQADPRLSVWKTAEAVAHRAEGRPGSSLRARRIRLIKGYKARFGE